MEYEYLMNDLTTIPSLRTLWRAEWIHLQRDRPLHAALVLLLALLAIAGVQGGRIHESRKQVAQAAQAESMARFDAAEKDWPEVLAGRKEAPFTGVLPGLTSAAVLPPAPLGFYSTSAKGLMADQAEVSLLKRSDNLFSRYELAGPVPLALGRFDALFVTVVLVPLLAIGACFAAGIRERESGMLQLLLTQCPRFAALIGIRIVARIVALGGALVVGLVAIALACVEEWNAELIVQLGVWIATACAVLVFWGVFAALAGALTKRSTTALTLLVGSWAFVTFLAPLAGAKLADYALPPPSPFRMEQETRAVTNEVYKLGEEGQNAYFAARPEIAKNGAADNSFAAFFYPQQRQIDEKIGPRVEASRDVWQRRSAWTSWLAAWNPSATAQAALLDLSGDGMSRYLDYLHQCSSYLRSWNHYLAPYAFGAKEVGSETFRGLPAFQFEENTGLQSALWSIACNGGLALLCCGLLRRTLAYP
jgi:ABC-type transport system involved in multi-copper enzyme maturation permease subunit